MTTPRFSLTLTLAAGGVFLLSDPMDEIEAREAVDAIRVIFDEAAAQTAGWRIEDVVDGFRVSKERPIGVIRCEAGEEQPSSEDLSPASETSSTGRRVAWPAQDVDLTGSAVPSSPAPDRDSRRRERADR